MMLNLAICAAAMRLASKQTPAANTNADGHESI